MERAVLLLRDDPSVFYSFQLARNLFFFYSKLPRRAKEKRLAQICIFVAYRSERGSGCRQIFNCHAERSTKKPVGIHTRCQEWDEKEGEIKARTILFEIAAVKLTDWLSWILLVQAASRSFFVEEGITQCAKMTFVRTIILQTLGTNFKDRMASSFAKLVERSFRFLYISFSYEYFINCLGTLQDYTTKIAKTAILKGLR